MLAEVSQAVAGSDAGLLQRSAHTLEASAALFGAQAVVDAALRLEMMGQDNNLASADQSLSLLESHAARLVQRLRQPHRCSQEHSSCST